MAYFFDIGSDADDEDDDDFQVEEEPIQKRSRVGVQYQAVVPAWDGTVDFNYSSCVGTCVWQPRGRKKSRQCETFVQNKSSVEPGGYNVKTHIYWMIHQWDYDIKDLEKNWARVTKVCPLPVVEPLSWKEKSLLYVCSVWVPHNWTLLSASIPERSLEELKTFWWKDIYLMRRTDGDPTVPIINIDSVNQLENKRKRKAAVASSRSPLDKMKRRVSLHNEKFY